VRGDGEEGRTADHERAGDDPLLRKPPLELAHGEDADEDADAAGADQVRERADALAELVAEDDERDDQHDALAHLVDADRGDRADRARGVREAPDPVAELPHDPAHVGAHRPLGDLVRGER
jgi:hypothetical protein